MEMHALPHVSYYPIRRIDAKTPAPKKAGRSRAESESSHSVAPADPTTPP